MPSATLTGSMADEHGGQPVPLSLDTCDLASFQYASVGEHTFKQLQALRELEQPRSL